MRSLGTIWFYYFQFTDEERPKDGKGLDWDYIRNQSVGRDSCGSEMSFPNTPNLLH